MLAYMLALQNARKQSMKTENYFKYFSQNVLLSVPFSSPIRVMLSGVGALDRESG